MLQLEGWQLDSRRDWSRGQEGDARSERREKEGGRAGGFGHREEWGREAVFGSRMRLQKTFATSPMGLCLLWCSHSRDPRGADFAAGGTG